MLYDMNIIILILGAKIMYVNLYTTFYLRSYVTDAGYGQSVITFFMDRLTKTESLCVRRHLIKGLTQLSRKLCDQNDRP